MKIITNYETIKNDLFDVMHLYYPDKELNEDKPILTHKMSRDKNVVENTYTIDEDEGTFEFVEKRTIDQRSGDALDEKRQLKRFAKLSLYKMLSNHFNKNMPWGALTGVRPTKIGYDLINQGVKPFMLQQALMENFLLSSALNHLNFVFSLSLPFYLPESLLRRICFVTPSNKGTQKRRKNEGGTKKIRSKCV